MKRNRNIITFEAGTDQYVLILAQLGQGDKFIQLETGATPGQISYRLRKAKDIVGLQTGWRVAWRNGNHPLFKRIYRDVAGIMVKEIERNIVPKIAVPEPKMVSLKETKPPTVRDAVRMRKAA